MPPLNIVLRSKTQVVDDSTRTKSSLTQCTLKECAGLKSHSFCTQFQPTTSSKPRTNHRSSATHRQNEPSEHYDKRKEGTSPWGANTRVAGNHNAFQNQPKARGTRLRARRSYASCTTAEIFRSSGWHATACCMNLVKSAPAKPGQKTQALSPAQSAPVHFWPASRCRSTWLAGSAGAGGVSGCGVWRAAGSEPLNPFGPSGDVPPTLLSGSRP